MNKSSTGILVQTQKSLERYANGLIRNTTTIIGRKRMEKYKDILNYFFKCIDMRICPFCGRKFNAKWSLIKHLKTTCSPYLYEMTRMMIEDVEPEELWKLFKKRLD